MFSWEQVRKIQRDNKRKRRMKRLKMAATVFISIFICVALNYQRISLQKQQNSYKEELKNVKAECKDEEERTEEIQEYKAYVQTKEYAEEYAREKMGLVYPDEIIFQEDNK